MATLGLPLQDFTALVRNQAAAMRSSASRSLDFATGTVLRALVEANASVALWLQWLVLQVLAISRAATSTGTDLDTWMADFGVSRLPAVAAHGVVTLSRLTPGLPATVPVGASVRTADGTGRFSVVADPANPAWSGTAYTLAAAASFLSVPVAADAPGSAGNLPAGALAVLATAIPGIDSATNPLPTAGGLDAEADANLRARFGNFIDSRSRATATAVAYAIQSVRQGLRFVLAENQAPDGSTQPGTFVVTADDGTGTLPAALAAALTTAIDAVRPLGSVFTVQPPAVQTAGISIAVRVQAPATLSDVAGPISAAVSAWVATLPIGATLPRSRLVQVAFAAAPAVTDVPTLLINNASADLVPGPSGVVLTGTVGVSVVP